MVTVDDRVWIADASGWRIQKKSEGRGYRGWVATKQGIVAVEQWAWVVKEGAVICLEIVHRGYHMSRRIQRKKPYSRRYLVTLAKRFAKEVVHGVHV